ncbi:hypothetical protein [Weissella muntiaci]|uniref:hypothetical protein n=1 Tax=Weissella muntiaci TaxID=2508881 RepID=UPI001652521A|nr:hypothetical protein [Weissella muntiaci]
MKNIIPYLPAIMLFIGFLFISIGAFWMTIPAGFIVFGILLSFYSFLVVPKGEKE